MTTATASMGMERPPPVDQTAGKRILTGSALYNEVLEFFYDEAALLDQQKIRRLGRSSGRGSFLHCTAAHHPAGT